MNKNEFINKVMEHADIRDKSEAEMGTNIVLSMISHRIQENEAKNCEDQLPDDLKRMWRNDIWVSSYQKMSGKRLIYRHKWQLIALVENELLRKQITHISPELLVRAVFHVLKEQITPGESADVAACLPDEIKGFYKAA